VARSEKPLSTPLVSMPQAPSPSDTGWVPPPARTAWTSSSAQAVTAGSEAGPPYSGISLDSSHPATAGWPANRRVSWRTNQACLATIHTSPYRSRPCRQAGSQFSPDMWPTMKVGTVPIPASSWASRKSANRASTSSSSRSGSGWKSGQKQNDRVRFIPWAARVASSARTTSGS